VLLIGKQLLQIIYWHNWILHDLFVVQTAALTKGELKWLANHMGHELNIHETVYRLQDSTIELAKVSRLLMAVDSGRMQDFAGKSLDQIQLAGFMCAITLYV